MDSRMLDTPLMMRNAAIQSRGRPALIELLLFLLIFLIIAVLELVLQFVPTLIGMQQIPVYSEMQAVIQQSIQNGSLPVSDIVQYTYAILAQLPEWLTPVLLYTTVPMILVPIHYCTRREHRRADTMGLTKERLASEYFLGLCVGLLLFLSVWGLGLLSGSVTLVSFSWRPDMLPWLLLMFFGYVVQGAAEEILCRGYLCVSISRRGGMWRGVFLSSAVFALLHIGNPGASVLALLNIFLFGILLSLYMIRRGNLWGACAIHNVWNFAQGNLLGLPVSGTASSSTSVFTSALSETGTLWNGGAFGPEGGLCVTIVLAVAIFLVILFLQNRDLGQKVYMPMQEDEPQMQWAA